MKAIRKLSPQAGFDWVDVAPPQPGPDEVLVKIAHASVCGTDVHITDWDDWSASRIKPPLTYGHEFCGHIEAVGPGVDHLAKGDYVSAEMHITCGICGPCMSGKPHICSDVQIAGIDRDGCYAEYIVLPKRQIIKLPPSIPLHVASCLDAVGNAVHSVERGHVSGQSVLITGCGPIGLFSIAVARALGATRVFATDLSPYRLELAEKMGAHRVFNPAQEDVLGTLDQLLRGRGIDVVIEMSGAEAALTQGFEALKPGGRMVLLGLPTKPVQIDLTRHIILKETEVVGVHGRRMFDTWLLMLELLDSGQLNLDPIFTHQLAMSDFGQAIDLMRSGQAGKVVLNPTA
ncbi:MAG: L-threonine 3-dehydrogenase [Vampirovibrionales bacterium]